MSRHYQFTIHGVFSADSEEHGREILDEVLGEVRDYFTDELDETIARDLQVDLLIMPRAYTEGLQDADERLRQDLAAEEGSFTPPAGVTHPWDQGAFFFPEDHPLASLEREAYRQTRVQPPAVSEGIKQEWVDRSKMMLPEGDDG